MVNSNDGEEESFNAFSRKKCCPAINRRLLIPKGFYFCFFSAWGSLLPYLALHFKQMLMNPTQVGILMGLKPFVNFLAIPVWGVIVDRYKLQRVVLLASMISLVISTFSIVFIPSPEDTVRVLMEHCNKTDVTFWENLLTQRGVIGPGITKQDPKYFKSSLLKPHFESVHTYSWPLELALHLSRDRGESEYYVDSTSTFVEVFLALFLGTLIGSPSLALVDTATMRMLGSEGHKYGRQRLTGSLGWGLAASLVGATLETTHRCFLQNRVDIIDYSPCFYTFGVMMSLATVITFGFSFSKEEPTEIVVGGEEVASVEPVSFYKGMEVLRQPTYIMFLFTALLMGFQMSFIKTFLFWHLKDMGANTLLFSLVSAVNCVAEVTMYMLSEKLILFIGQQQVLYLGLVCYSLRLFYYAAIQQPWLVLVVELLPGITTAAAWASLLSYVNINSKPGYQTTMQCILHSCHWGLGYGLGEVIGGVLVHSFGAQVSFIINGVACLINLLFYAAVSYYFKHREKNTLEEINELYDEENCRENNDGDNEFRLVLPFKQSATTSNEILGSDFIEVEHCTKQQP